MFRKRVRQLNRYREIVTVLTHYGFGLFVSEIGLNRMLPVAKRFEKTRSKYDSIPLGERIRRVLEELGPTFIKLGQVASTRPDIIPLDILKELEKLQDNVPSFSYNEVQEIIEHELGAKINELFLSFSETPLAAASIGQVHQAILLSGEEVVIKVQRPNVQAQIETDLEILMDLAILAENHFAWAKTYQIKDIVGEFSRSMRDELDYQLEGRNAEKIKNIFKDDEHIYIPKVYWEYTTSKVLTLEYVKGIKLSQYEELESRGFQPKEIAERIVKATFEQVLIHGFFHGDPHPGNLVISLDGKLAYLDFGMVGRLTPDMKYAFSSIVIALMQQNTNDLIQAVINMGLTPDEIDMKGLYRDVDLLREKYMDMPLSKVSLGEALLELFSIAFKHQIRIPSDLTMLGKMLLTMEGIVEKLDPELSILDIAKPYGKRLLKERYNLPSVLNELKKDIGQSGRFLIELPKYIREILLKMSKGQLKLDLTIQDKEPLLRKIDRLANLMALSITFLGFSIILTGLIISSGYNQSLSIIHRLPLVELGLMLALGFCVWIILVVIKSRNN